MARWPRRTGPISLAPVVQEARLPIRLGRPNGPHQTLKLRLYQCQRCCCRYSRHNDGQSRCAVRRPSSYELPSWSPSSCFRRGAIPGTGIVRVRAASPTPSSQAESRTPSGSSLTSPTSSSTTASGAATDRGPTTVSGLGLSAGGPDIGALRPVPLASGEASTPDSTGQPSASHELTIDISSIVKSTGNSSEPTGRSSSVSLGLSLPVVLGSAMAGGLLVVVLALVVVRKVRLSRRHSALVTPAASRGRWADTPGQGHMADSDHCDSEPASVRVTAPGGPNLKPKMIRSILIGPGSLPSDACSDSDDAHGISDVDSEAGLVPAPVVNHWHWKEDGPRQGAQRATLGLGSEDAPQAATGSATSSATGTPLRLHGGRDASGAASLQRPQKSQGQGQEHHRSRLLRQETAQGPVGPTQRHGSRGVPGVHTLGQAGFKLTGPHLQVKLSELASEPKSGPTPQLECVTTRLCTSTSAGQPPVHGQCEDGGVRQQDDRDVGTSDIDVEVLGRTDQRVGVRQAQAEAQAARSFPQGHGVRLQRHLYWGRGALQGGWAQVRPPSPTSSFCGTYASHHGHLVLRLEFAVVVWQCTS